MAFSDSLRDLGSHPSVAPVARAWRGARTGPPLRISTSFAALYVSIAVLMRHNRPANAILVYGAILGLLYALVAFGLILIYRANRIINFAQASMGGFAGLFGALLIKRSHVPYVIALPVTLAVGALCGVAVEVLVIRRFSKAPRLILSVATIGVALIFAALQFYLPSWMGAGFNLDPTPPKTPFSGIHFTYGPQIFDANALVVVFATLAVVAGLSLFFKLTDIGVAVRASAENADRAALLGIPVKRVSTIVWMLAAALSALGLFLRIPVVGIPIGADIGPSILIYPLAAAVIAKMEKFSTALAAGIAIGVIEQALYVFSRDPNISRAVMLPLLLGAMLLQRNRMSRGQDSGVATWKLATEFRPVPPELRTAPEVAWSKFGAGLVLCVVVLAAPYVVGIKQQELLPVVVAYGIVAVSLVILTGWAGQISLGQWGFAAIGAAVAGGMAAHLNADFFVTLIVAGLVGAAAAVVVGLPALRIQGLYLAVTTLAFAIAVQVYVLSPTYFSWLLPNNSQTIERPVLYHRYNIDGRRAFYYVTLAALVLCLASARALRRSQAGRVLIAARDNERGAQAFGVSVRSARLWAFAISGFWAAIAGALFAYHQRALDPNSFDPTISLTILIIVVIGGLTSLPGAMVGTLYFGYLKYGDVSQEVQSLASGLGVLLLLMFFPGGLAQVLYGARDSLLRTVARRRGIHVPSLVADQRQEDAAPPPMPVAEPVAVAP